ncbi:urease accessory protein [Tamilnaduibacter salinus]|uniref:Urease accessory protein UreD n=1 Tax=Tamilnaduibacter salinus TaxID=1484056 RepID=A0A2U1CVG9_9GAMM|nr:urease accessory protein UreD [Tamilnaduibacter salinus]PVY75749.1 urease accessory protein [Tamilnaduibacter salinus]
MTVYQPIGPESDSGHRFDPARRWAAWLDLRFAQRPSGRGPVTQLVRNAHDGPLRVQRPFHPEGPNGCCHVYLLHPPGGLVSGDALTYHTTVETGAHALVTTPAAAKLYQTDSHGVAWTQHADLHVEPGATLEWLPQETLAFNGSRGTQSTRIDLADGARCLGWEMLALGRPASDLPFVTGRLEQRFHLTRNGQPLWIERQTLDPHHRRFRGAWGQGGATVQATLWAVGLEDDRAAIEALREAMPASGRWAVTQRQGVLLLRYIGDDRNEAWDLCEQAWTILRPQLTGQTARRPRIWST